MNATGLAHLSFDDSGKATAVATATHPLASQRGRDAIRAFLETAVAAGATLWTHEKRWNGATAGRSQAVGARIGAGQGEAVGMLKEMAFLTGALTILSPIPPARAKRALTGNGRATKPGVMAFARTRYGVTGTEHEADAVAVAVAAYNDWDWARRVKAAGYEDKSRRVP
jgi:hypothetical protein